MKRLCTHCQSICKKTGLVQCKDYNAIADRPNQLPVLIREAINNGDHKKVKELKEELDQFYYGKS
jgi:hypothetical protein